MSWTLDLDASRERLLAERARTRAAIANDRIVAPGPMTYGSQAAAASQVFEQQRDLALREQEEQHLEAVEAALARLDAGLYGACTSCGQPDRARATRRAPVGRPVHRMPAPGRPAPMTSRAVETAAELVGIEAIRAAAADASAVSRCIRRSRRSGRPNVGTTSRPSPSSRSARSRSAAPTSRSPRSTMPNVRAASSRTRRGTTRRASRAPLGCSAHRPWSSCPAMRPRSSATGSRLMARRSWSSAPPARSARRSPSASPWSAACRSSRPTTTTGSSLARGPSAWR